jgi:p-aminobenzoyl-glutamate transporter AbgT
MVIPENGILRDPINHTVMPSPFIKGIVPLIILFFFVVSLAYGIATRTIRRQADLPHLMIEPMKENSDIRCKYMSIYLKTLKLLRVTLHKSVNKQAQIV